MDSRSQIRRPTLGSCWRSSYRPRSGAIARRRKRSTRRVIVRRAIAKRGRFPRTLYVASSSTASSSASSQIRTAAGYPEPTRPCSIRHCLTLCRRRGQRTFGGAMAEPVEPSSSRCPGSRSAGTVVVAFTSRRMRKVFSGHTATAEHRATAASSGRLSSRCFRSRSRPI